MNDEKKQNELLQILKGKKIFIVEDDLFLSKLLIRKISTADVDVGSFDSGESIVERLKGEVPDLLLLDLMLPQMTGFEVLQFIRNNDSIKDLKVIVLSNTDRVEDKEKVKSFGAEFETKALVSPETILKYCAEMIRDGKIVHEES